jgi:hypothetical protein
VAFGLQVHDGDVLGAERFAAGAAEGRFGDEVQQARGLSLVDAPFVAVDDRQAHTAETEGGDFFSGTTQCPVFRGESFLLSDPKSPAPAVMNRDGMPFGAGGSAADCQGSCPRLWHG